MDLTYLTNPAQQIDQYQNWSLEEILHQTLNSQSDNDAAFAIALGKARQQPCNPQSLSFALQLFARQPKWIHLIQRFAQMQFKLVFSFCIKNLKTYPALIQALHIQGDHQRQTMFETNIENAIDVYLPDSNISFRELWEIYIEYLKNWFLHLPHRTIYALQKIEIRLSNTNNIYLSNLAESDVVRFTHELARIVRFHELAFMKRFELRKFWNSISATITFLKDLLNNQSRGSIEKLILTLQSRSVEEVERNFEQRKAEQKNKEEIVLFLTYTSQVSILQQTYLHTAERLAKQLVHTYVIDYWNFKEENTDELVLLENSLIYQVQSDDLPSLIQQLLCSLAKHIPSFLTHFLIECSASLFQKDLDQISISDIVLKLCILSKQIIQHYHSNQENINIKEIISRVVNLSDSRSELVQIKTLKLMHYFREILPDKNFISYHEIIFRVIRRYLTNQIEKREKNQIQIEEMKMFNNYKISQSIYTNISYNECIKILQEQTEKPEDPKTTEMRIRKAKFAKSRMVHDLVRENENWISDKFLELICISGYCMEQSEVFKLYRNFLGKYTRVAERSACSILKVLVWEFMIEFERLKFLNLRQKEYQKLFEIANCIILVVNEINQDSYIDCQTLLEPVLSLIKEPYEIEVEKELLTVLAILIEKAGMITPELSKFIVYTQEVLKKGKNGMTELRGVIQQLCKPSVVRSVTEEWSDLVLMLVKVFREYIVYMMGDGRVSMYEKEWMESLNLAQLFFQTYEEELQRRSEMSEIFLEIQFEIEKTLPSEVGFQMLMTIHHIEGKSRIYSFYDEELMRIGMYEQRYSLVLGTVGMMDMMEKNLRERVFEFDECNEGDSKINRFVERFVEFRKQVRQVYMQKQSSPNDELPLGRINPDRYIQSCLESLYKQKRIDTVQFIDLKNRLLDPSLLVKSSLFQ